MDRKEFLKTVGLCCSAFMLPNPTGSHAADEELEKAQKDREFFVNWVSDLLETMDGELDESKRAKLFAGAGRGCYRRHQFKQDIAIEGRGDVEKLVPALRKVFGDDGVWREKDVVHIRFNSRAHGCFCPVGKSVPARAGDQFCECHASSQQSIFKTALDRTLKVDVLDSVRRGGENCHFLVHL